MTKNIKGMERYTISENGIIVDTDTNNVVRPFVLKGRQMVKLLGFNKRVHTRKVDRLMQENFDIKGVGSRIVWKDGDKLNNSLENLEVAIDDRLIRGGKKYYVSREVIDQAETDLNALWCEVGDTFGYTREQIRSKTRLLDIVLIRIAMCYILSNGVFKNRHFTLAELADIVKGVKDHSISFYYRQQHKDMVATGCERYLNILHKLGYDY